MCFSYNCKEINDDEKYIENFTSITFEWSSNSCESATVGKWCAKNKDFFLSNRLTVIYKSIFTTQSYTVTANSTWINSRVEIEFPDSHHSYQSNPKFIYMIYIFTRERRKRFKIKRLLSEEIKCYLKDESNEQQSHQNIVCVKW